MAPHLPKGLPQRRVGVRCKRGWAPQSRDYQESLPLARHLTPAVFCDLCSQESNAVTIRSRAHQPGPLLPLERSTADAPTPSPTALPP